jgi:hypothetical protein
LQFFSPGWSKTWPTGNRDAQIYSILGPGGSPPPKREKPPSVPKITMTRPAASNLSFLVSMAERTTFEIFHLHVRMGYPSSFSLTFLRREDRVPRLSALMIPLPALEYCVEVTAN